MNSGHTQMYLTLTLISLLASPAFADPATDRIDALEARVSALEKRLSAIERTPLQSKSDPAQPSAAGDWKNKSNWRLLRKGMSKDQVRELVGEPEKIEASGPIEHWRWKYPFGPSVTFYDEQVYGWDEK